jgi:hypothetical protein
MSEINDAERLEEPEELQELEYQFLVIEEAITVAERLLENITPSPLIEWLQKQECPVEEPLAALFKI